MPVAELPPRGHYLAHEVGQLAGVSGDQVGQWARYGYIRSSQPGRRPRVYSYQDVAEAMMVHELRLKKVDYRTIRKVLSNLRERYGSWPLSNAELLVAETEQRAAKTVVVHEEVLRDAVDRPTQGVVNPGDLVRVVSDLRRGGWAVRSLPGLEHIEVDPDRLSGRPTIKGRRVSAENVAQLANSEEGRETLREDYDLDDAQIDDALKWWAVVSQFEFAAAA
jgi:uncharacterized protein (DUF433 family)